MLSIYCFKIISLNLVMNINTLELLRVLTDNGLINHIGNIYFSVSKNINFT